MNCIEAAKLLMDLAYGEIDDDQSLLVGGHLAECVACRALHQKMTSSMTSLDEDAETTLEQMQPIDVVATLARASAPQTSAPQVATNVSSSWPGTMPESRKWPRGWTAVVTVSTASCIAVALLVLTVVITRGQVELSGRGIGVSWGEPDPETDGNRFEADQRINELESTLARQDKETQLLRRQLVAVARVLQSEDELRRSQLLQLEGRLLTIEERGNTRWKTMTRMWSASQRETPATDSQADAKQLTPVAAHPLTVPLAQVAITNATN